VNEIPMMSVAFGQKGRCEMKVFEMPMLAMSVFGFGLLSGFDVPPARADFTFGEPVNVESTIPVIDGMLDCMDCFSLDGLEMYIEGYDRPGGRGRVDIWVSKRATTRDAWGPLENLGPLINTADNDNGASISGDGLVLYFASDRAGGYGGFDTYITTRANRNAPWGSPVNMGPKINGAAHEGLPSISADGLELYFTSGRFGGYGKVDIYVTRRASTNDPWGEVVNLGPLVNSAYSESDISLSPDGLLLLFNDEPRQTPRPGGYGGGDMWVTRRASRSDPWQTPVNLGPKVNGPHLNLTGRLSPDGHTFYFGTEDPPGIWDIWQTPILPIVDFDGDGWVDGKDLLAMIVQWGGNDSLCDIGPYAWGDGVVDFEDLKVFAEYVGKEVVDGTLIAHWKLDETEGTTAHDSAGTGNGIVTGNAMWQPAGGQVGGALAFDGVDDFVVTQFELNPGDGPFSVLAWVKGGAPGEVVVSQQGGADWLYTNPIDGSLMTGLMGTGTAAGPGFSDVVITDGQWHRIGIVWDGTNRILLVDGQEAARDTQTGLTISDGELLIGTGTRAGSFWSGLIDDVRVYNRAVAP
jgi:hypothetical protein